MRGTARGLLLGVVLTVVSAQPAAAARVDVAGAAGAGPSLVRTVLHEPTVVYQKFREVCLRDFQGPEGLRVEFHPTPAAKLLGGYIAQVDINGDGGGVDYVRLEKFRIRARGLHFDLEALMTEGRLDVRRVDQMDLSLAVSEDAFNGMFRHHSRRLGVRNARIEMHDGELAFSGSVQTFVFKSQIEARGPIELTPEGKVNFNLRRLRVSGLTLPGFITRQVAERVNPITDFRNFQFWNCWNMSLRSVVLREGSMTLSSFPEDEVAPDGTALARADEAGAVEVAPSSLPTLSTAGVIVLE